MMTSEQRLDRLERIVRLMIKAGLRARRHSREQDEKINVIIEMHSRGYAEMQEGFAELRAAQMRLTESQMHTDRRLDSLIDIVKARLNGNSH